MKTIDKVCADFDRPDVPGLALMVIENGEATTVRSYGLANLETGVRCEPQTNFRLASVTKQFTAMSILMLAESGDLSLDDKLPRFFPDFPPCGNEITIRHLLTHASGLLDYEELIPPATTVALKNAATLHAPTLHAPLSPGMTAQLHDQDVLEILRRQDRTYFAPGSQFRYSNSGYVLLGLIAGMASGYGFSEFLRMKIFLPLQMDNTFACEKVPYRALGYTKRNGTFEETDQDLTSATLGDGGIYSSVNDLFKWDEALYTEELVSQTILRQAFTPHARSSDAAGSGYGFGWYVEGQGEAQRLWHHGSSCGFSSSFHRFPARKCSVILLANRRDAGLEAIARKIAP